jgi:type IV fimbrial biogenesis protein FimT
MKRRSRGFTLMELAVTLAVAAVLLGIGVPSFRDFMRSGRLTGAANETLMTVIAARSEAVRRQVNVSVCPSTAPSDVNPTCTGAATQGFVSFVDTNNNCQRDGGEDVVASVDVHSEVTSEHNTDCITFGPNGFRLVVAGQPTTSRAIFCDEHGNTQRTPAGADSWARGIEILPTGRPAVSRLFAELTTWGAGANPVVCP